MPLKPIARTALSMLLVLFTLATAQAAPKAQIDKPRINLGDISQGKSIQHDFIVQNSGDEPLSLQVKPC